MTQPGETDSLTASEHARALLDGAGAKVFDYVVVNEESPSKLLEAYAEEGQVPVRPDIELLHDLGVKTVTARVISETQTVRHDSAKLAGVVISTIEKAIARRASFVRFNGSPKSRPAVGTTTTDL